MSSVASSSELDDAPGSGRSPDSSGKNRRFRFFVIGGVTLVVVLLLFLMIGTQGHVTGQEFSPTHFQQREFSFYEIPGLQLQITPIRRKGSTSTTARYVRVSGFLPAIKPAEPVWHLVSISRGLTGTTPANAQLLTDQLELTGRNVDHWRDWSRDHKPQANILWPQIASLARRELYVLMPPLFELAQKDLSPAQLQQQIDRQLRRDYYRLIIDMRAAKRTTLADQLLDEALQDYPDDANLRKLKRPTPP